MDDAIFYRSNLESFTDDLSKYDAGLYLGLKDVSVARYTIRDAQEEAAAQQPYPPPPAYIQGPGPASQLPNGYALQRGPSSVPMPAQFPGSMFRPAMAQVHSQPRLQSTAYNNPTYMPQNCMRSFSAMSGPRNAASVHAHQPTEPDRPATSAPGMICTSASMLKAKLSGAPVPRQDNLFIRSSTSYSQPAALQCRLPVNPMVQCGYYGPAGYY